MAQRFEASDDSGRQIDVADSPAEAENQELSHGALVSAEESRGRWAGMAVALVAQTGFSYSLVVAYTASCAYLWKWAQPAVHAVGCCYCLFVVAEAQIVMAGSSARSDA